MNSPAFVFLAGGVVCSGALALLCFGLFHILRNRGLLENELAWGIIQCAIAGTYLAAFVWMLVVLARGGPT